MSSLKPVIHGRDHLPGGADPIPTTATEAVIPPLPFIRIEKTLSSMALAPGVGLAVDFTGASVSTNDNGRSLGSASTTLSPFTGTYFSFNWGTDTHKLYIIGEGLYLVYRYWTMLDYDFGSLSSPAVIGVGFTDSLPASLSGHGWLMANVTAAGGVSELTQQSLMSGDADVTRLVEDSAVIATTGSGCYMTSTIQHTGQEGNLNQAAFGMAAVRIGSYQ